MQKGLSAPGNRRVIAPQKNQKRSLSLLIDATFWVWICYTTGGNWRKDSEHTLKFRRTKAGCFNHCDWKAADTDEHKSETQSKGVSTVDWKQVVVELLLDPRRRSLLYMIHNARWRRPPPVHIFKSPSNTKLAGVNFQWLNLWNNMN